MRGAWQPDPAARELKDARVLWDELEKAPPMIGVSNFRSIGEQAAAGDSDGGGSSALIARRGEALGEDDAEELTPSPAARAH